MEPDLDLKAPGCLGEGHGNPPQGNQEPYVVKDKVGKPLSDFGGKQVHGM